MITLVVSLVRKHVLGVKSVGGGNLVFSLVVLTPFFLLGTMGIAKGYLKSDVITSTNWTGTIQWQAMATGAIW